MNGKIYLIPTVLHEDALQVIPQYVHEITRNLTVFFVEEARTARRYLRKTGFTSDFDALVMMPLNEHTDIATIESYIQYALDGKDCGIMSEAGVPAVADPGHVLVRMAHELGIQVIPLSGPSSIILALMASGLNGQQFVFHGYIPVKQPERNHFLERIGNDAAKGVTQIVIETPYRNNSLVQDILKTVSPSAMLCIASGLTGPQESIHTYPVEQWRKMHWQMEKVPAIFLLGNV